MTTKLPQPIVLLLAFVVSACSSLHTANNGATHQNGERTVQTAINDIRVENEIKNLIKKELPQAGTSRIELHVFHRTVLITGQVPDTTMKEKISRLAEKVAVTGKVHNELEIRQPLSWQEIADDSLIATRTKGQLVGTDGIDSGKISVIVENRVLYLMGLVTQEESERIVRSVKSVPGLTKIVRAMEIYEKTAQ